MRIDLIVPEFRIKPWKPALNRVPHLTIETNMTCNFRCHTCYNRNRDYVKDLKLVLEEIDTGLRMRKADTITILGGEPTLYPDLVKVVSYIKSKGVLCQMLTNGYLILNDPDDKMLHDLVSAGLGRIMFHVDKGQDKYSDPISVLHKLFEKTEKLKLLTSISWTVYNNDQGYLPVLVREFSKYSYFDGVLALLEKPMDECVLPGFRREDYPNIKDEHDAIWNELKLKPSVYLPDSRDDRNVSWLVYMYYINSKTLQTFCLSPAFTRFIQHTYARLRNREMFGKPPTRTIFGFSLMIIGLLEFIISPRRIRSFFRLFRGSSGFKNLRFHYITIQDSPYYNNETKNIAICYHCFDATIRNGKLTPVCFADRINPLSDGDTDRDAYKEIETHIYNHLGQ